MKVIFNADDLGLTKGVNLGIEEAFCNGVVSSATIMANQRFFEHGVEIAKRNPGMGVGVHLVLTLGHPIVDGHKTIVDGRGDFLTNGELRKKAAGGGIDINEVEREFVAQIEAVMSAGLAPTHLDGHHHTHLLEGIVEVTRRLAHKYRLPVRANPDEIGNGQIPIADAFYSDFYGDNAREIVLEERLLAAKEAGHKLVELMCHPAYIDYELMQASSYCTKRPIELSILSRDGLKAFLADNGIGVVSYLGLKGDAIWD